MIFKALLEYRLKIMHPTNEKETGKILVGEIRAFFTAKLRLQSTPPLGYKYQIQGWKGVLVVKEVNGVIEKSIVKDELVLVLDDSTQGEYGRNLDTEKELGIYTFQDHVGRLSEVKFVLLQVAEFYPWDTNSQAWGNPEVVPVE